MADIDKYGIVRKMIQMRTLKRTARADRGGGLVEAHPRGITEWVKYSEKQKTPFCRGEEYEV